MKENIEKKIETFVYGLLSLVFGAAFFFGVLYPTHGISPNAYRIFETKSVYECTKRPPRSQDKENIRYTFYFYERLKNS